MNTLYLKRMLTLGMLWLALGSVLAQPQPQPGMAFPSRMSDAQLDSLNRLKMLRPTPPGSTRKGKKPVLFLIGDSTTRQGTRGNGDIGQWGWGFYMEDFFDTNLISVENQAMGGMSSRTFYTQLWAPIRDAIQPGDWVFIQMGHNDNGGYQTAFSRASAPGAGKDTVVITKTDGTTETVYTFGGYMRLYIQDVRARGGHPVLLSLTPRNSWDDNGKIIRSTTHRLWTEQVAQEMNVPYIDMSDISARKFETFGRFKTNSMFYGDGLHSSAFGAKNNATSAVEGIRSIRALAPLAAMLKADRPNVAGQNRKPGKPVVFVVGDSTAKNSDNNPEGQWGWGSVLGEYFDADKAVVDNQAMAGRSARTFLDEGRWDRVYEALQPGDVVLIQFGHNDGGEIGTGKARAELKGSGDSSRIVVMAATRRNQVIYTYGWYIRKFISETIEKGATPIVLSLTQTNVWTPENKLIRSRDTYVAWAKEAAGQMGAYYIDLNEISGTKLERLGKEKAAEYFKNDHVHTSLKGAHLNAQSVVRGIRESPYTRIKSLLKEPQ